MQRRATHCSGTIGCTAARRVGNGEDGGKIILRDRYLEPAPRSDGRVSNEFKFLLADTDINSKLLAAGASGCSDPAIGCYHGIHNTGFRRCIQQVAAR